MESVLLRTAHFLSAQLAWPTSRQAHRYMAQRCILLIKPWREGSPPEARGVAPDTPPAGTDNWRKSHKQQTLITAADSQAPCGVVSDPPLASWTPREELKRRNRQGVCTRLSVLILFFFLLFSSFPPPLNNSQLADTHREAFAHPGTASHKAPLGSGGCLSRFPASSDLCLSLSVFWHI